MGEARIRKTRGGGSPSEPRRPTGRRPYARVRTLTLLVAVLTALGALAPLPGVSPVAATSVDVPTSAVKLTTGLVRATDCGGSGPPTSCGPVAVGVVGDVLFFKADDGVHGTELWISDGTAAGTSMVKDIYPGITSSMDWSGGVGSSSYPAVIGNTLIFEADDGVHGRELWKSDGTEAGTVLVKDLRTELLGDGTNPGSEIWSLTTVGTSAYFRASTDGVGYGNALWKTDGTGAGTVLVKNFYPSGSVFGPFVELDGEVLFAARDGFGTGTSGRELWKSDGTEAGTVLVKDIRSGEESSALGSLTTVASTLFFAADDGVVGRELWKSDGTEAGTLLVKDIVAGSASSEPQYLTAVGGTLFFESHVDSTPTGIELWKSDGTEAGTILVKDIAPGTASSQPQFLTAVGPSTLALMADDGTHGNEPWKSDGTEAGTVLVNDIRSGGSSSPSRFTPFDGLVYFTADDGVAGNELWKTDLTTDGTKLAVDVWPGISGSAPQYLTVVGDMLIFDAEDSGGRQLWRLNRAPEGTTPAASTPVNTAVPVTLAAIDADGDSFSLATTSSPSDGVLSGTLPDLTYTPDPGFVGVDTFTYTATDTWGAVGTATATIRVFEYQMLDDFEDGDVVGWSWAPDGHNGFLEADSAVVSPNGGGFVGKATYDSSCYGPGYHFDPVTPSYFSFYFRADGDTSSSSGIAFALRSTSGEWLTDISLHAGSLRFLAVGGVRQDIMPASMNVWYLVELRNVDWDTDTFDIWVNGVEKETNAAFYTPGLTDIRLVQAYACPTTTGPLYVDDIRYGSTNQTPVADDQTVTTDEDTAAAITLTGSDPDGDSLTFAVTAGPSHGALTGTVPDLTYDPDADWNGADSFTVTVFDGAATSPPATVSITVDPVNDEPSFTEGADVTVAEDAGPQSVSAWATGISSGPANESAQTVGFTVSNDNNALFTASGQPAVSPTGTLSYTAAPNANGDATASVFLVDSGPGDAPDDNRSATSEFLITVTPDGDVFYVDLSATGANDGSSWADAFTDLQDALSVAFFGDKILVAAGTYLPSDTDTAAVFKTVHDVDLEGSYPAGGGLEADFGAHPTVLSGDLLGNDDPGDPDSIDDNSVIVVDVSNTHMRLDNFAITAATGAGIGGTNSAVLIGFGLIDGNHGRGVHLSGTTDVFIAGPTISNNSAGTGAGGGVYLEGPAVARFADVIIEGNSAASGAGAFVEGTVTMYNTVFRGNTGVGPTTDGGGLKLAGAGDSVIMNSTFVGNEANVGSAIVVDGGGVSIVNSTFTGNGADPDGGTLIQLDAGSVSVDNGIVWNNFGSTSIAGTAVAYSIVQGGMAGTAVLDADPLFKDADGLDDIYGTADDDVRLLGTSPAIDAGDNFRVPPDTLGLDNDDDTVEPTPHDLDHRPRFFDRGNPDTGVSGNGYPDDIVDMGAFELGNEAPSPQPDSYTTNEDVPLVVGAPGVLANDSDPDGDAPLQAQSAGGVMHGTLILGADGSFTFTPEPDYNSPPGDQAQFQYQAVDPTGALTTQTVDIYVNNVNDAPSFTLGGDRTSLEDGGEEFVGGWVTDISAGPPDEAGQVLTFTLTPADPSLFEVPPAIDPGTGAFTYTPVPDANGSTEVSVVLSDDGGVEDGGDDTSATQTFTVTIEPVNDEPFLVGNDTNVLEGSHTHTFSGWATEIKAGPPDESAQSLAVTLTPTNGSLFSVAPAVNLANGDLSFTLAPGATGSSVVTITLTDDGGTANGGDDTFVDSFTITIDSPGDGPPGADDWSFDMDESGTISGTVFGPGDGGGGCIPTVVLVTDVLHGTLVLNADGSFTYSHDGSSATTDNFAYKVLCGGEESAIGTVSFTVSLLSYSVGLVDPASGQWHLRSSFTDEVTSFYFGNPGDVAFMGDWDCDGIDSPGLFRLSDAYAYLRNANSQGIADIRFFFGDPGDIPLPGDFNGDGCDTLSLYRPSTQTFFIMNALGENEGGLGGADYSFVFGNPGDKPVVGDWDGDGITEIGLHRESTGFFYWRDTLTQGIASDEIFFGDPGDRFVAGDFGVINGVDTPAVFRPVNTTFYFRHSLSEGNADSQFVWGESDWMPVAGVTR